MFEQYKLQRKIKAFRRDGVKCTEYKPDEHTITLETGSRKIELAFNLVMHDQNLHLAFSGDAIASDGAALARVMKVMWDKKLPVFDSDAELRKQLGKPLPASEPHAEETHEDDPNSAADSTPETAPLFFRDMAGFVAGMPNEVVVTVKASYRIDND